LASKAAAAKLFPKQTSPAISLLPKHHGHRPSFNKQLARQAERVSSLKSELFLIMIEIKSFSFDKSHLQIESISLRYMPKTCTQLGISYEPLNSAPNSIYPQYLYIVALYPKVCLGFELVFSTPNDCANLRLFL
jgi:hypothetical protein